jgi:8-oxo-dGTP pyrophosphatase MutT (NUDIX family)
MEEEKKLFKNRRNKVYIVDGKEVWESRSVAVNCVVVAGSITQPFILLGKRGKGAPDSIGLFNVPSGYLDYDESGTEAVYREVWEETGLYLPEEKIVINNLLNPWYINTHPGENRQNVTLRYGCVISLMNRELPKLTFENSEPDEVEELRWIPVSELGNYKFAFNHDTVIKQYLNLINY